MTIEKQLDILKYFNVNLSDPLKPCRTKRKISQGDTRFSVLSCRKQCSSKVVGTPAGGSATVTPSGREKLDTVDLMPTVSRVSLLPFCPRRTAAQRQVLVVAACRCGLGPEEAAGARPWRRNGDERTGGGTADDTGAD